MKSKALLVPVVLALSLSAAGSAFAQGATQFLPPNNPEREEARRDNRQRYQGGPRLEFGRQHEYYRSRGRGVGPNYAYYQGDRLPNEYRHRNYVVDDWRGHRLSAPPRGYHWVQSGNDYILIAIATGIIAQILLSQ